MLGEGRERNLTQSLLIRLLRFVTYTIRRRKLKELVKLMEFPESFERRLDLT